MIRAPLGDSFYWNERVSKLRSTLDDDLLKIGRKQTNPGYQPQFWLDHATYALWLIISRYSKGDAISELGEDFYGILDGWELSNRWVDDLRENEGVIARRDWIFDLANLNHYNKCFWFVGLALILNVPEEQWCRLVALVSGDGQDALLDRVIATRQPGRSIGKALLHPKPYARLLKAIDAPKSDQAELLHEFVSNWYLELARKGAEEPWWYIYGDPVKHPLNMGSYFGRWCIEAAVVAKVFGIDDSLCVGIENYPGDFLRPDGPSTHISDATAVRRGFFRGLFDRKR
jgi:hypothetical protein